MGGDRASGGDERRCRVRGGQAYGTILQAGPDDPCGASSEGRSVGGPITASPMQKLGKYELLTQIAKGGMAEIWVARTKAHGPGAVCVVKRLLPQHVNNDEY